MKKMNLLTSIGSTDAESKAESILQLGKAFVDLAIGFSIKYDGSSIEIAIYEIQEKKSNKKKNKC